MEISSTTPSALSARVMRRVYTIHAVRPLTSGTALALALAVGSLYLLGRKVWVAKVFANMPNPTHVGSVLHFFVAAFFNTTTVVQVLCVAIATALMWLVRDALRALPRPIQRFA